jgi:formate dehydrogenase major subunit
MIDEIGLPWHWGYAGIVSGDIVNDLTASVGDAITQIPETKAFLCNIRRKDLA